MIEQFQDGLLSHSYYICCYDGGETVRSLMDGKVEGNEDKLSAFARYTAALHQAGILHLDYSPGNILIHQNETNEYSFSLVDVNRMQLLSDIDCDTVCRNMCRLCISREVLTYMLLCVDGTSNLRSVWPFVTAISSLLITFIVVRHGKKKKSILCP